MATVWQGGRKVKAKDRAVTRREAKYLGDADTLVDSYAFLSDVVANPFHRLPPIDPGWLARNGGRVNGLAQSIYEGRIGPKGRLDKTRLRLLANALEEAGVTDQEVLQHLHEKGRIHVRGCWVVDWVLRRK